jgi:outer membrane protein assembly factor BamB
VVVATGYLGQVYVADPTARLYVADLKTGQVRWSVKGTHSDPVITASEITSVTSTPDTGTVVNWNAKTGTVRWKAPITDVMLFRYLAQPQGPDVIAVFPGKSDSARSRLLSINLATGKAKATDFLPYTAAVDAAPAVSGSHVLLEPESVSCAPPVHP